MGGGWGVGSGGWPAGWADGSSGLLVEMACAAEPPATAAQALL